MLQSSLDHFAGATARPAKPIQIAHRARRDEHPRRQKQAEETPNLR
jgi:hypothetical protein